MTPARISSLKFIRFDLVTAGAVFAFVVDIAVLGVVRQNFVARHRATPLLPSSAVSHEVNSERYLLSGFLPQNLDPDALDSVLSLSLPYNPLG